MVEMKTVISAGGIVWKDDKVLLVRVTYGSNKGMWMLPGGLVEPGESVEDAAIREVMEESGVKAMITGISGIRTSVRIYNGYDQTNIYLAFSMKYLEGEARPDNEETSEIGYFTIKEIIELEEIVGLSRELIVTSAGKKNFDEIEIGFEVNNGYKEYKLYQ